MKRSTASSMASGGTGQIVSPPSPRASRLVASTRSSGQCTSSCSTTRADSPMTCSQLSMTTIVGRSARCSTSRSRPADASPWRGPASRSPMPTATASGTAAGSPTGASSTRNASCSSWPRASSCARRVFPAPPGPTIVTSRWAATRRPRAARSSSRPMKRLRPTVMLVRRPGARPRGLGRQEQARDPGGGWPPRAPAAPDRDRGPAPRRAPRGPPGRPAGPPPAGPTR